ncbi:MAG: hypothetical protein H0T17_05855 [Propionibacteriales bacterium]|nr:hypothetical protein [Propionibacteriales bacterium]
MRMMLKAQMDTAVASKAIQEGRMPTVMQTMMEKLKPEAAYFGPGDGKRTAYIIFQMDDPSQLPAISEPLFSEFNARVDIFPVMDRDDLEKGLSALGSHD